MRFFPPFLCFFSFRFPLPPGHTLSEKRKVFSENLDCFRKTVDFCEKIAYNNNSLLCRCRLAVWRQLPKLIPASSTLVTCSINRQVSTRGLSILLIYTKYLYCAKSWQWSIDKQKIYTIIRSRLQAKSIKSGVLWDYYYARIEIVIELPINNGRVQRIKTGWSLLPKGEIKMATPFSGFAN